MFRSKATTFISIIFSCFIGLGESFGNGNNIPKCPVPMCAPPAPGCKYVPSKEKNEIGCPKFPCGKLECSNCPMPACAAPAPGCKYVPSPERNSNGCPKYPCGKTVCSSEGKWGPWSECKCKQKPFTTTGPLIMDGMDNPFHADGNLIIPTTTTGPLIMDGMDNPFLSDGNPMRGRGLQGSQLGVQTRTCKYSAGCPSGPSSRQCQCTGQSNVVSSWAAWTVCSKSCGGGIRKRVCAKKKNGNLKGRKVTIAKGCPVGVWQNAMCNPQPCEEDVVDIEPDYKGFQCEGSSSPVQAVTSLEECIIWSENNGQCGEFTTYGNGKCFCQLANGENPECEKRKKNSAMSVYFVTKEEFGEEEEEFMPEIEDKICDGGNSPWTNVESATECADWSLDNDKCGVFFSYGKGKCACQLIGSKNEECEIQKNQPGMHIYFLESEEEGEGEAESGSEPVTGAIPKNCAQWYDGCNTCKVKNGQILACTRMMCISNKGAPKCLKTVGGNSGVVTSCDKTMCPMDICPDGKGRRQIGTKCCACPVSIPIIADGPPFKGRR